MNTCREAVVWTCSLILLVCGARWFADAHEPGRWFAHFSGAGDINHEVVPTLVAVRRLEWSADGQKIVSLSQGGFGPGECLAVHDAVQGSGAVPIDVSGEPVGAIALAPDSRHLAVGTHRGRLWWIDLDSLNTVVLVEDLRSPMFTAAAVSADGRVLAAAAGVGGIYLCNPAQGTALRLPARRQSNASVLRFSGDGRRLISAHNDGSICHWDLSTRAVLNEFAGNGWPVTAVAFLSGDRRIISTGLDNAVRIRNLDSGHEEWRGESGDTGITTLAVSPDGRTAAWGGYNRRIVVWDLELNEKKFEFKIPAPYVTQLRFAPDGTTLAVAGREAMIRLYDMRSGTEREGIHVGQSL
jgi:WD40 repeat protein